jgi:hypothetical protein
MKARWLAPLLGLSVLLGVAFSGTAYAASIPPTEKGLLITPLRQFPSVSAGTAANDSFSVANLTDKPLTVNLSVKQFSVSDYVYNYTFEAPDNDWLHLALTSITLQPNQTQKVDYTLQVPAGSAPGGHYYTLFASANLASQGLSSTIQAADLVYLTVNGKLNTVSHLQSSSIHWLSFGRSIPFSLDPINTGNVYSFVSISSQLHGLFVRPPITSGAHLLMPGHVRSISDSIPSPLLPGVYRATYGYKNEAGWIIQQSHLVVFIPPWFLAFILAALLVAGKFWPRKKHRNTDGTPDSNGGDETND